MAGLERAAASSALSGAEARYRAIVDTAVDAILVVDAGGVVMSFNPAAERLFGYAAQDAIGASVRTLIPETDLHADHDCLARFVQTGARAGAGREISGLRRDGSAVPLELTVAEWWSDGQRFYTAIMRDISERVRALDLQRLLLGELNHRVKNSLAAVQAVAGQTLRNATDLKGARIALDDRLLALSRAHDVLTREKWEGADLADIISAALETSGMPGRFTVEALDERLTPKTALATAMALHELCTNAAKHGALSNADGKVAIRITREADAIRFVWRESGGPQVSVPTRRGFGTRMIDSLARDLQGAATLAFEPAGLVCTITAPLAPDAAD
ncbi:MAG TPA: PAS domain S-box protein [Caulobacteraceae bacterium]|nr:PAS domain S-box protein [Caulobacteraceae bacterium]